MKANHYKMMIVISLITIGSLGCTTTKTVFVTNPLERPARPALPPITTEEALQVPKPVWTKIVQRSRLQRQYAETLEVIIDSTQAEQ